MQISPDPNPISNPHPTLLCTTQFQSKQHILKIQNTKVQLSQNSLDLLVLRENGQGEKREEGVCVRVMYRSMLSVARNCKDGNGSLFKLVVFVNDGDVNGQEEFDDQEQDEKEQLMTKQMQIIQQLEELTKPNPTQNTTTSITITGCFTVTLIFTLLPPTTSPSPSSPTSSLSSPCTQLQKQVTLLTTKNTLLIQYEQLYEQIVNKLNKLEDCKNGENSNRGISNLLRGGEEGEGDEGEGEEWEDQEDMGMEDCGDGEDYGKIEERKNDGI